MTSGHRTAHQSKTTQHHLHLKLKLADFVPIEHKGEKHPSHFYTTRTLRAYSRLGYVKNSQKNSNFTAA